MNKYRLGPRIGGPNPDGSCTFAGKSEVPVTLGPIADFYEIPVIIPVYDPNESYKLGAIHVVYVPTAQLPADPAEQTADWFMAGKFPTATSKELPDPAVGGTVTPVLEQTLSGDYTLQVIVEDWTG